ILDLDLTVSIDELSHRASCLERKPIRCRRLGASKAIMPVLNLLQHCCSSLVDTVPEPVLKPRRVTVQGVEARSRACLRGASDGGPGPSAHILAADEFGAAGASASEGIDMIDRIAHPWGTRTPYGPGEQWPVRVDMHLAEGISEEDVETWVPAAAILHSTGDALDIAVSDGRVVGARGHGRERVNRGRLGPQALDAWQANGPGDPDTRPRVRENGGLGETGWDAAMGRIVSRSKDLLETRGPRAYGFYTSGA